MLTPPSIPPRRSPVVVVAALAISLFGGVLVARGLGASGAESIVGIVGGLLLLGLGALAVFAKPTAAPATPRHELSATIQIENRISAVRIVRDSWRISFQRRRALGSLALVPFPLGIALGLLRPTPRPGSEDPGTSILLGTLFELPFILFAVQWHRVVLLDEKPDWRSPFTWSSSHFTFVSWAIALQAFYLADPPGDSLTDYGVWAVFFVLGAYIIARTSLILPAVAIGEPPHLGLAWSRSKGRGWKLLAIYVLAQISCVIAFAPLWGAAFYTMNVHASEPITPFFRLAMSITFYGSQAVMVASLSLAFGQLMRPGPGSNAVDRPP